MKSRKARRPITAAISDPIDAEQELKDFKTAAFDCSYIEGYCPLFRVPCAKLEVSQRLAQEGFDVIQKAKKTPFVALPFEFDVRLFAFCLQGIQHQEANVKGNERSVGAYAEASAYIDKTKQRRRYDPDEDDTKLEFTKP